MISIANNVQKCKMSNIIMTMNNPLTLIVFGATGDLYQNKLSLALFNLFSLGFLPTEFMVIGFARRPLTDLEFQNFTRDAILRKSQNVNQENLNKFLSHMKYIQGDLENLESFKNLSKELGMGDQERGACSNKLFYLAVPPTLYGIIFKNIFDAGLSIPCASGLEDKEKAWARILVEKPFGKDLDEAEHLDKMLGELFDETQIFRIDHYLGKETLQNILSFRFMNGELEKVWDNKNIEKVRIIFHEENTVANRGALYDGLGILRDVGQNHMLQMLALVTMENPGIIEVDSIRDARKAVLENTVLLSGNKIVRGQYEEYLNEANVKIDSETETFFRVFLGVDTARWRGIPFELEAGKALAQSEVFIEVYFKNQNTPHKFLISGHGGVGEEAYEKVLYDCILGDQTIFTTTGEIMAQWKVVEDIIEKWQSTPLTIYKKGSAGAYIN